jgi:primosomal protein N'
MDQQIENEHLHQQLESTLIAYADKQDAAVAAAAADDARNRIWRRFLQLDSHVMLKSASSIFIKVMNHTLG